MGIRRYRDLCGPCSTLIVIICVAFCARFHVRAAHVYSDKYRRVNHTLDVLCNCAQFIRGVGSFVRLHVTQSCQRWAKPTGNDTEYQQHKRKDGYHYDSTEVAMSKVHARF